MSHIDDVDKFVLVVVRWSTGGDEEDVYQWNQQKALPFTAEIVEYISTVVLPIGVYLRVHL